MVKIHPSPFPSGERSQRIVNIREDIGGGSGDKQQPEYQKPRIDLWSGGEHREDLIAKHFSPRLRDVGKSELTDPGRSDVAVSHLDVI